MVRAARAARGPLPRPSAPRVARGVPAPRLARAHERCDCCRHVRARGCRGAGARGAARGRLTRRGTEERAVARVADGDTIELTGGARVRLVQVDAPELGSGECYSRKAATALRSLIPAGAPVRLERDPRLDGVDRYARLLRYVHRGTVNVNVELVRRGAATVWFYDGPRGRHAARLRAAGRAARPARRGLWGACRAVWNPYAPATTAPTVAAHPRRPARRR
ncbi:MAG: thermonuclease family protein, partial [Thermoleophilia bacterium]|nr:thermonuclease family protein [Thermoleophilia bacterium]